MLASWRIYCDKVKINITFQTATIDFDFQQKNWYLAFYRLDILKMYPHKGELSLIERKFPMQNREIILLTAVQLP